MTNHVALTPRLVAAAAACIRALCVAALAVPWSACEDASDSDHPACVDAARDHTLPLPSSAGRDAYLDALTGFLSSFEYRELGWCEDKGKVRDTGPYVDGVGYQGTHPPVHMVYSPQAIDWLLDGREPGAIPDGTLVIKEQWYKVEVDGEVRSMMPAAAYEDLSRDELDALFRGDCDTTSAGWTTMIKDAKGSVDGWFWAEVCSGLEPNDPDSFTLLTDNFGSPCARCHASAEVESSFMDTDNIAGFPGTPKTYDIQDGWRTQSFPDPAEDAYKQTPDYQAYPLAFEPWLPTTMSATPRVDDAWLAQYPSIDAVSKDDVTSFPAATLDHVPHPPQEQYFVTADQCLGCHGGLSGFGDPMFVRNHMPGAMGTGISPSDDWRFTPMGLAGRDPIFYAQLETEVAMVKADGYSAEEVAAFEQGAVETCMSCHGGPGVRQAQLDGVTFKRDFVSISDPEAENFAYGALARDGINCTLCHHIAEEGSEADFFRDYTTGRLAMSPPGELYGPFEDDTLHPKPMEHGIGFTPKYGAHMADSPVASRLCGHCHTINLPVIDDPKREGTPPSAAFPIGFSDDNYPFPIHAEQATYTEWLNSDFQTIFGQPGASARSCQDCHMSKSFGDEPIETIIASIQDSSYPEVPYLLPDLQLQARPEYGRHLFVGLNVPLLQMFNQFYDVLGVNKKNYMTGFSTPLNNTIAAMLRQADKQTLTLDVDASVEDERIQAQVTLTNLTGHRFPSGVAFRRAWIEVLVVDRRDGETLWGSGRTNGVGVIVDGSGAPLATEFFDDNVWQPHYDHIDSEDQVQIYEEVALDAQGDVTYSFLRRDHDPKDNRLLPKGWTPEGPSDTIDASVMKSTHPEGAAKDDPSYQDGSGRDIVSYDIARPEGVAVEDLQLKVTVYYQSTSPAFLHEKFTWSPEGPATRRLYYLMSNLGTKGTAIEDWKLALQTKTVALTP